MVYVVCGYLGFFFCLFFHAFGCFLFWGGGGGWWEGVFSEMGAGCFTIFAAQTQV